MPRGRGSRSRAALFPDAIVNPHVNLIAALARNRVIGRGNTMPWHLPADLKRFRALTLGHPVIMGRRTYESIGRPLPDRQNIVVSRSGFASEGVLGAPSLEHAIELAGARPMFVIGGGEIYRLALPLAARLHLTEIQAEPEGDTWFPEFDRDEWRETSRESGPAVGEPRFAFVTYERRKAHRARAADSNIIV